MNITLPYTPKYVLETLTKAGYQAYIVGGSVRDKLLGHEPDDYDVTTNALPEEVMKVFRHDRLIPTGIKHGTITLLKAGMTVEITTFRIDGDYNDNRHPDDVLFTGNLYEDVQRRDFTINAMCWNPNTGLIDYTGGSDDIEAKLVRCVGVAEQRFNEDALRILRALRFSSVLDFDIEPNTAAAIHSCCQLLKNIAVERILVELNKLLCGKRPEDILLQYRDVFDVILPELSSLDTNAYLLAARRISLISAAPVLRMAALLCDLDEGQVLDCCVRLKMSKADRSLITGIAANAAKPMPCDRFSARKTASEIGIDLLSGAVQLRYANSMALCHMVIQQNDCISIKQLAVNGEDVFRVGVTRRNTGVCLQGLLDAVIHDEVENTKEALIEYTKLKYATVKPQ